MSESDVSGSPAKIEAEVSENGDADKSKMETDQDDSKAEDQDDSKTEEPVKKESLKKESPKKETPKKKEVKKKKEEEEEEDNEEDDDDEEPQLGLLERPIELTSGKREKKKVERLAMSISLPSAEKKKVDIPEGKGTKLGDCPRIEFKLNQIKAIDLKPLHRLLFNRAGSSTEIKKNIRQFSGFLFVKGDKEFDKRMALLNKMTLPQLKQMCEVLDIERSGTKSAIIERIMDFVLKPTSSGLKVPNKKKRKSKGGGDGDKKKGTKRKQTSKKDSDDNDDDEEGEEEEGEKVEKKKEEKKKEKKKEEKPKTKAKAKKGSDSEDEDEEEEAEEEEPPKKKAKTEKKTQKKEAPKAKKQNGKQEKAKTDKKKETKKKSSISDSDADLDSDDEPLVAPSSKKEEPPTNVEIKDLIKKILEGANLEEVTMKTVVKQVYDKYPTFDLTDRKDFIKSTVREIIS